MKKMFLLPVLLIGLLATYSCSEDDPVTELTDESGTEIESTDTPTDVGTDADEGDAEEIEDSYTISIVYSGTTAAVTIPANLSEAVTCTSGTSADVVIANTDETNELAYEVSGSSTAGSLTIDASYKMTLQLNGVSLTSASGPAINVKCGKRIAVILTDGTTNTLADAAGGDHSGCLRTKGHFEFSGGGTLNVTGNTKHGISSKEYTLIKKSAGTINIVGAASDAFHIGQYFQMNGGTVNIDGQTLGDGIQVDYETDDNDVRIPLTEDAENTGDAIIKGGTLNITMNGDEQDTKCLKTEGNVYITGGTLTLVAARDGSRGIQTDGNVEVSATDNATTIDIKASGDECTLFDNNGETHRCMGMKIDGTLSVFSGTVKVNATGDGARTVRCASYTVSDGATFTYNKAPKTDK